MDIETLAARYSGIPSHWKLSTLGESLMAIIGGGTPSRDNPSLWGGTIPWLTVKDMRGRRPSQAQEYITEKAVKESATNIIPPDTVITATRVGLGKVVRVPFAAAINQDLKALVVGPDLDKSYLEYWLVSIASFLESIGSGTTVKGIRLETLRQLPIPLAPLKEQREIVAEIEKQFSRLDEAVANLQRVKAKLKRYKASILKAAVEGRLVETEASIAQREGRSYETGEQLLQRILEARRVKWTGRGKYKPPVQPPTDWQEVLPEGWTVATADQLTYLITSGSRGWGDFYSDTGILFIRAQDIKTDALNLHDAARVDVSVDAEGTRSSVSVGDILVTITGANVTKSALVPEFDELAFVSQHVALMKLAQSETAPFVFNWIVSPANGRKTLESWAYGAGKPGLSLEQVRSLPIALPPLAEQIRIAAEVDRHLSVIRGVEAEVDANIKRSQVLRQSTLSKVFTY
jgi:type I restriction enzyme S subunit